MFTTDRYSLHHAIVDRKTTIAPGSTMAVVPDTTTALGSTIVALDTMAARDSTIVVPDTTVVRDPIAVPDTTVARDPIAVLDTIVDRIAPVSIVVLDLSSS